MPGNHAAGWGSHGISIHRSTAPTHPGDFFVHGGTILGRAGCIDLTSGMPRLAARIAAAPPGQKVKPRVACPVLSDFSVPPPAHQRPA